VATSVAKPSPATLRRRRAKVAAILPILEATYPHAECALHFTNPLELAVATILSAQCTDARVNLTTPTLFARYKTAADYATADPADVEALVGSCGFFRAKTKNILGLGQALVEHHAGEVPADMDQLVKLPGIGRKTANVILNEAFGLAPGVTVDTHVARLSQRLGLTKHDNAVRIERDLMLVVPEASWGRWPHLLIFHGRGLCNARKPRCDVCPLLAHCPHGTRRMKQQ
jgi:endonuclease-3